MGAVIAHTHPHQVPQFPSIVGEDFVFLEYVLGQVRISGFVCGLASVNFESVSFGQRSSSCRFLTPPSRPGSQSGGPKGKSPLGALGELGCVCCTPPNGNDIIAHMTVVISCIGSITSVDSALHAEMVDHAINT
eukprot:2034697-Amphidinium_carterae.1